MKRLLFLILLISASYAEIKDLTLDKAVELVKKNNSDIKIAKLKEEIAKFNTKIAKSYNYGSMDMVINALRSNDAGNVFGFKLQSREAKFIDFGFDQFLAPLGQVLEMLNANPGGLPQGFTQDMGSILNIEPKKLNYPEARNHFQTKLSYKVPLFTGMKLTMYEKISKAMEKMSHLDAKKVVNQKLYETKKTFWDIALVENYIKNLKILKKNMDELEYIIKTFKEEGYAKHTDVLEVRAKKIEVLSYLNQAKMNRDLAYQYISFLTGEKIVNIKPPSSAPSLPKDPTPKLVKKSIDFKKVKLAKKITKMNVKLNKSGFYPTLGAFGEYGSSDDKFLNRFFDKDAYTVGAQFKWNLFSGGKDKANYEKARVEYMKVNEQYNLAQKGLALKINQIKTEVKSRDYDIKAQQAQFDLAKEIYKMYKEKYKEGLAKISDVLIKHSEEIQVLLKLLETKTKRNEKVYELESLIDKGE